MFCPSYRPFLTLLSWPQQLSKVPNIPFRDLLTPKQSNGALRDVPPPHYASRPGFQFNLRDITQDRKDFFYKPGGSIDATTLATTSGLDPSQIVALQQTLSQRLSLIVGPLGTGKSFTGCAIIRVLVGNRDSANLGPIICVAHKNQILDQLLERLLRDRIPKDKIVRVGSESDSEVLLERNLRTVAQYSSVTLLEGSTCSQAYLKMDRAAENGRRKISSLKDRISTCTLKEFLLTSRPAVHEELFALATGSSGCKGGHHGGTH